MSIPSADLPAFAVNRGRIEDAPGSQAPLGNPLFEAPLRELTASPALHAMTTKRSFDDGVPKRSLGTRALGNEGRFCIRSQSGKDRGFGSCLESENGGAREL